MRFLIQKVKDLKIKKENELILDLSQEEFLYLIYVGIEKEDENKNLEENVKFLENCQIIDKEKFEYSIKELKPKIVLVSQITLIADFEKNGRINFDNSIEKNKAEEIFNKLFEIFRKSGYNIYKTEFGSYLEIESKNIGPVNFYLKL